MPSSSTPKRTRSAEPGERAPASCVRSSDSGVWPRDSPHAEPRRWKERKLPVSAAAPTGRNGLKLLDVLRRGALSALHDVELHAIALGEALEALRLDGRVMDEAVLLTALGGDETEALGVVKPFHGAGRTHPVFLCVL